MKRTQAFIFAIAILALSSCQKEISGDILGENTPNGLIGTWKFINLHGITNSTQEIFDVSSDVKTVTITDYITINNQGTYTFGDTSITGTGIAYDVSTTARGYVYENGNLDDSTDFPFAFSVPPTSSNGSYRRISSDSLYFPGGSSIQISGASGMLSPPGGCTYTLAGDTLTLVTPVYQSFTDNSMGLPVTVTDNATAIITLARQ